MPLVYAEDVIQFVEVRLINFIASAPTPALVPTLIDAFDARALILSPLPGYNFTRFDSWQIIVYSAPMGTLVGNLTPLDDVPDVMFVTVFVIAVASPWVDPAAATSA